MKKATNEDMVERFELFIAARRALTVREFTALMLEAGALAGYSPTAHESVGETTLHRWRGLGVVEHDRAACRYKPTATAAQYRAIMKKIVERAGEKISHATRESDSRRPARHGDLMGHRHAPAVASWLRGLV